jgi:hypothetical protein
VATTCERLAVQLPADAACGCVEGSCKWWSASGSTLAALPSDEPPTPNSGEAPSKGLVHCGKDTCKPGQTCVGYYGIAGPSGPKFESCEWTCKKGGKCPAGTTCITIADGPGPVCRASGR